jgi:hypothetical protein
MIKVIKEVKESQTEVKPFPKLMINSNEEIVYFIRWDYGLPINGNYWNYGGLLANIWDMKDFKDYNEPVTIQNI